MNIHWQAVDTAKLRAVAHNQLAGLQAADSVATSYYYGVKLSRFGIADPGYMRFFRPHVYRHRNNCFGSTPS